MTNPFEGERNISRVSLRGGWFVPTKLEVGAGSGLEVSQYCGADSLGRDSNQRTPSAELFLDPLGVQLFARGPQFVDSNGRIWYPDLNKMQVNGQQPDFKVVTPDDGTSPYWILTLQASLGKSRIDFDSHGNGLEFTPAQQAELLAETQ